MDAGLTTDAAAAGAAGAGPAIDGAIRDLTTDAAAGAATRKRTGAAFLELLDDELAIIPSNFA